MNSLLRPKSIIPVAILGIIGVATAYAFWSGSGSGSGNAPVASTTTPLTAHQTTVLSSMYPGDNPQAISGNFDNPNDGPAFVQSVTASIQSVTKAVGAPAGTCDASDFTLSSAVMAVGADVPTGNGKGSFTGASLHFNNKPSVNQDACKGATVNLAYAVN